MVRTIAVLSALDILLLAVAPAAPVPKAPPGPVYYYPTTVGDTWTFSGNATYTVTVAKQKDSEVLITVVCDNPNIPPAARKLDTCFLSVSDRGVYDLGNLRSNPVMYNQPVCWLSLLVKPGDRWKGFMGERVAYEPEEVTVGAGTFQAVRIDEDFVIPGKVATRTTEWYAPRVGCVRKSYTMNGVVKSVSEMTRFTPGNGMARAADKQTRMP